MKYFLLIPLILGFYSAFAQETFPVNGIADPRSSSYAFTHAHIAKEGGGLLDNATLIIRDGKIINLGLNISIPKDAVVVDCEGKFIYPSFIDLYTNYGMPVPERTVRGSGFDFRAPAQFLSNQKGPFGWNQAIKSDLEAAKNFSLDETKAKILRELGFGSVLTHEQDGIARGTGVFVSLASKRENLVVIKEKASAHYSFSKGSSTQSYPSSLMGTIALLRQNFLDASWYKSNPNAEGVNISLKSFNEEQGLPQIFEGNDKWNDIRADRLGDEFGVQYIIKGGGNEYQIMKEIAATHAVFILPLNFPQPMDVEDPNDVRFISLGDLKHWELAPTNPAVFARSGVPFCLTTADLRDPRLFTSNLKKALDYGLSSAKALEALTKTPAQTLGVYDKVGSLEIGKIANFLITTDTLFSAKSILVENWVQGEKYPVRSEAFKPVEGTYNLTIDYPEGEKKFTLNVKSDNLGNVVSRDTLPTKFSYNGKLVRIIFSPLPNRRGGMRARNPDSIRSNFRGAGRFGGMAQGAGPNTYTSTKLSGTNNGDIWQGTGVDSTGARVYWKASFVKTLPINKDSLQKKPAMKLAKVTYPFGSYGWDELPKPETILIKNATVWTNEKEGKLEQTDVLVKNGKIAGIGKNLKDPSAQIIDGTGKHLTAGIIDEHSHIAAVSINEGGQSVTSEVRIADNLNPDDIEIYRQLAGGVTSSHILHGSANTIGGQTQLIKLRWGHNDQDLKFEGAPPFIKFALGENVKRTTSTSNNRFPDTRMGVEEVQWDAFTRAQDYEKALKGPNGKTERRDLELDALVEILNHKRFITCHSYVQSEITETIRMAEHFGFTLNTFTHILEGYKVADKMKAHGSNAGTFSDWFAYKMEVQDAIPYNASLMHRVGVNVAINSDDAEQARRLNQEAAKSVKYGGMAEEDALKMVTLNPAKMLHVDQKVGSIKLGKDADLVLWTDHPLSVYTKAEYTLVDGIIYYSISRDEMLRKQISEERNRIIQKMSGEKKTGMNLMPAVASMEIINTCDDHEKAKGLLILDSSDIQ